MFRRRRAPLWFYPLAAAACAVVLRALVPPAALEATGGGRLAFLGFLVVIGELIWDGLQVAAQVTLAFLQFAYTHLSLLAVKLANGLRDAWGAVRDGFRGAWDFLKGAYEDVLKPAWQTFWRWFDNLRRWLQETFQPVLDTIVAIRDTVLCFWKTYVQPWLDMIDVTRKLLRVVASFGVGWARALDKRLGEIEDMIERPFRLVLGKINEVINAVNLVMTADGLLQRVALVRSIARDYQYAWRAMVQPYTLHRNVAAQDDAVARLAETTPTTITRDYRAFLVDGGGADVPLVSEMATQLRIYLESGRIATGQ